VPRSLARWVLPLLLLALVAGGLAAPRAQEVSFSRQFLQDPKTLEIGRKVWAERCAFCHGKTAYPGKAPRLQPARYTPEFVYDRVTFGFGAMPPWKDAYSELERKAVSAYVVSPEFAN
jgi:mono/diheme cytochrome c family protein